VKTQTGFAGRCKIHDDELELLASGISRLDHVLEIGTLDGVTASLLARRFDDVTIVSADIFEQVGPDAWLRNRRPNMRLWVGTATQLACLDPAPAFQVIFVDADHRYDGCRRDLIASDVLASHGGRIFVHDYRDPERPGVTKALDKFVEKGHWRILRQVRHLVELVRK